MSPIESVIKRDGRREPFRTAKIIRALDACLMSEPRDFPLTGSIVDVVQRARHWVYYNLHQQPQPEAGCLSSSVIHDIVVECLLYIGEPTFAYRFEHFKQKEASSDNPHPSPEEERNPGDLRPGKDPMGFRAVSEELGHYPSIWRSARDH